MKENPLTARERAAIAAACDTSAVSLFDPKDLPSEGDIKESRADGSPSRLLSFLSSHRKPIAVGAATSLAGGTALSGTDLSEVIKAPVAVVRNIFDVRVVHADGNPNYIDNNEEPNPDGPPTDNTGGGNPGDDELPIITPTVEPHTTPTQPPTSSPIPKPSETATPKPTETQVPPTPKPTETQVPPTPTSTPVIRRFIQFIVKKRLDTNRNGQFDSQDRGMMQQFRGWIDRNLNRQPDPGEPVQSSATDPNGVSILTFEGSDLGSGTQVCAKEFDVAADLAPVVSEDCAVVDGGNTAEVRLLNKNREVPPPTVTVVPPTVEPTVAPRREEPKVAPPPAAPEVAPPAPPQIPQVCLLPNGQEVPLPEEFKAKLVGKDAQTIADMLGEFKCEFIEHDVVMREEHKGILNENKFAHAVLVEQHGDQTRILKGIDRDLDTVRAGITDLSEDHETQTGILKDLKERVGNGWSAAREWATIGLSAATLLLVGGLLLHRRRPEEGQPLEPHAPVAPPPPAPEGPEPGPAEAGQQAPPAAEVQEPGVAEAPAQAEVPEVIPAAAAVIVGQEDQAQTEPEPGRFTDEQIQTLARVFEGVERLFNQIDRMSDDAIRGAIRRANMPQDQLNQFKQALRQAIMILSPEEDEDELNRLSSNAALIRRFSVSRRAINQTDLLRIAQAREQLRTGQVQGA